MVNGSGVTGQAPDATPVGGAGSDPNSWAAPGGPGPSQPVGSGQYGANQYGSSQGPTQPYANPSSTSQFGSAPYGGYSGAPATAMTYLAPTQVVPPPGRGPNKVLIGIVAAVVALAVLVGGGAIGSHLWKLEQDRLAAEAARVEHERQVALAADTVRGFFDALARADVEAALSYGSAKLESQPLLTSDVVRKAVAAAPITELAVVVGALGRDAAGDLTTAAVKATYRIGGDQVTRDWNLIRVGEDWRFEKVTSTVDLSGGAVAVKIHGVAANRASVEVLPGGYVLTTDDKVFALGQSEYVSKGPGEASKWTPAVKVRPEALQAAAKAVTASYRACAAKKNIGDLYGCPFGFRDPADEGYTIPKNGFLISSKGNAFANPKLVKISETEYSVTEKISYSAVATATKGGAVYIFTWDVQTYEATAIIKLGGSEVLWDW